VIGSLAARGETLYVAWPGRVARWRAFDLGGRALTPWMELAAGPSGLSACAGLEVDPDHRLWFADPANAQVRCVNLFGQELSALRAWPTAPRDGLGTLQEPLGVGCAELGDPLRLWVCQGGARRSSVQLLDEAGRAHLRLRSLGDPRGVFEGARRVRAAGRWVWVLETQARRIQVFRDAEFHFAFQVPGGASGAARRSALPLVSCAVFDDGSGVVCTDAQVPALLRIDRAGHVRGVLAEACAEPAQLEGPCDLALLGSTDPARARVALLDRDGLRVRAFGLEGTCHGAIEELAS
jgi:hypothetical protein